MFKEDWGEQMVGKHHPVLCVVAIETGEVSVLEGVPDELSPGLVCNILSTGLEVLLVILDFQQRQHVVFPMSTNL